MVAGGPRAVAQCGLSGVAATRAPSSASASLSNEAKDASRGRCAVARTRRQWQIGIGHRAGARDRSHRGNAIGGPLPRDLAVRTLFTGGIDAESQSVDAAKALIEFLKGHEAATSFRAKGFEKG